MLDEVRRSRIAAVLVSPAGFQVVVFTEAAVARAGAGDLTVSALVLDWTG
jgi:hypothetical protein